MVEMRGGKPVAPEPNLADKCVGFTRSRQNDKKKNRVLEHGGISHEGQMRGFSLKLKLLCADEAPTPQFSTDRQPRLHPPSLRLAPTPGRSGLRQPPCEDSRAVTGCVQWGFPPAVHMNRETTLRRVSLRDGFLQCSQCIFTLIVKLQIQKFSLIQESCSKAQTTHKQPTCTRGSERSEAAATEIHASLFFPHLWC